MICGETSGMHLHVCQINYWHTLSFILRVLHVSDSWMYFICIQQILFGRAYILKIHICDSRLLLT